MIILIPAYEPDDRLIRLAESIRTTTTKARIVVVDDGSGIDYQYIFDALSAIGCTVISYPDNRGKGYALKAGIECVRRVYPGQDVVCADCDGQHAVDDILRVATRLRTTDAAMVLGARQFTGDVPARSRLGNRVTSLLVRLATHLPIHDTQTGLRGYPASMLDWVQTVDGDRFEYELNLLLQAADAGFSVEELEIKTIYLDHNSSSHFRPLVDSARVYAPLLKFTLSSLLAFSVDTIALLALNATTGALLPAVIGARIISSTVNFLSNRLLVFTHGHEKPVGTAAMEYWTLAAVLLAANYGLLSALTSIGLPLLAAKTLTEALLFAVSFQVQKRLIFTQQQQTQPDAPADGTVRSIDRATSPDVGGHPHHHDHRHQIRSYQASQIPSHRADQIRSRHAHKAIPTQKSSV